MVPVPGWRKRAWRSAELLPAGGRNGGDLGDALDSLQALHVVAGVRPRGRACQQRHDAISNSDVLERRVPSQHRIRGHCGANPRLGDQVGQRPAGALPNGAANELGPATEILAVDPRRGCHRGDPQWADSTTDDSGDHDDVIPRSPTDQTGGSSARRSRSWARLEAISRPTCTWLVPILSATCA